jgi:hypothetical protein
MHVDDREAHRLEAIADIDLVDFHFCLLGVSSVQKGRGERQAQ